MKIRIPIETFKELLIKGQCKEFRQAYQREFYRSLMKGDEPVSWEVDDYILSIALKDLKERQDENAFKRLRILYKKRGDFKNMKRVLLRYAEVFGFSDVWVEEQYKRYTKGRKQSK